MEPQNPGIRQTALQLAATLVDIGHTRLQLAATEIEEERLRLARQWLAAACALYLIALAVLLACAWIVLATPAEQRVLVLGLLTAAFAAAGAWAAWRWRALASRKPMLLSATIAELREDAAALRAGSSQ
ncbi:MAG: phage holin family protein [Pseudomonadota bacterium]